MKTPEQARAAVLRIYERHCGDWLTSDGFPLCVNLDIPSEKDAALQPAGVMAWVKEWQNWPGPGRLETGSRRWKSLGTQELPVRLHLDNPEKAALFCGQYESFQRAESRYRNMINRFPAAAETLKTYYQAMATWPEQDWQILTDILVWLDANPASALYIRQIPVTGLDTKWVQNHKGMIQGLLAALKNSESNNRDFFTLTGLKKTPRTIRMRILDRKLTAGTGGLKDIQAPLDELVALPIRPQVIFIVENLETGLALPVIPDSVVLMGLGFAAVELRMIRWLDQARVIYWGDLDTHGFAILQKTRAVIPSLESLLMDRDTLLRHRILWGFEKTQASLNDFSFLSVEEAEVFTGLKENRWGDRIRLEQERLDWKWVTEKLKAFQILS